MNAAQQMFMKHAEEQAAKEAERQVDAPLKAGRGA